MKVNDTEDNSLKNATDSQLVEEIKRRGYEVYRFDNALNWEDNALNWEDYPLFEDCEDDILPDG